MKRSPFMRLYACVVGVLLAAILVSKVPEWRGMRAVYGAVAQPFYLERGLYERNQTGALSMYAQNSIARSSDGRTAAVQDEALDKLPPGKKLPQVRKVTASDGSSVWLMDSLHLKTSWPKMTSREAREVLALMANRSPDCGFDRSRIIGRENMLGQNTFFGIIDSSAVREVTAWYAPELGCQMLQHKITLIGDGTVLVESRVLKVVVGEPDARLFDLGDSYQEILPSQFMSERTHAIGQELDAETRRKILALDREQRQTIPGSASK